MLQVKRSERGFVWSLSEDTGAVGGVPSPGEEEESLLSSSGPTLVFSDFSALLSIDLGRRGWTEKDGGGGG